MTIWTMPRLVALGATLAAAAALYSLTFAPRAQGADIRAQLTPELIAQHCAANGIGSNVEGRFLLNNGQRLTGSVLCAGADMITLKKASRPDDEDNEGGYEDEDGDED